MTDQDADGQSGRHAHGERRGRHCDSACGRRGRGRVGRLPLALLVLALLVALLHVATSVVRAQQITVDQGEVCAVQQSLVANASASASASATGVLSANCKNLRAQAGPDPAPPVYVNSQCVIDADGYPTCTRVRYPWRVRDANTWERDSSVCFLFRNGTVGCIYGSDGQPRQPLIEAGRADAWQPEPLQLVDESAHVSIVQMVRVCPFGKYVGYACWLLSNQTIGCVTSGMPKKSILAVPAVDPVRTVIQLRGGTAHACVLYDDGSVACWGECPDARCSPPQGVAFSSIDCGDTTTCGIRLDGSIACFGNALTSSPAALTPPQGVFSQLVLSTRLPCAVSATDATVHCWAAAELSTPNALVASLSPFRALIRARTSGFEMTPSLAGWDVNGFTAGLLLLPPALEHASFLSVVPTSWNLCVLLADAAGTDLTPTESALRCFGDPAQLRRARLWPPPAGLLQLPLQRLDGADWGGADQMLIGWRRSGELVAWGAEIMLEANFPSFINNNSDYRWSNYRHLNTRPTIVCGVLLNQTAVCVSDDPLCAGQRSPEQILAQLSSQSQAAAAGAGVATALRFLSLEPLMTSLGPTPADGGYCVVQSVCGAVSDGSGACWGPGWDALAAAANTSVFLLPAAEAVHAVSAATRSMPSSSSLYTVCALVGPDAASATAQCWVLQSDATGAAAALTPITSVPGREQQQPLRSIMVVDLVLYGVTAAEGALVAFVLASPLLTSDRAAPPQLPSLALQVAPQFHYREKAGRILPCPQGTFSLGAGSITPLCSGNCLPGRYGLATNNTNSLCGGLCPKGHYCPPGATAPVLCPAGTYGAQEGLALRGCSGSCLAGYYCGPGSTVQDAQACPAGQASNVSSRACEQCPFNSYSEHAATAECSRCSPGSFAPRRGATSCSPCPASGMLCELGEAAVQRGYWAVIRTDGAGGIDADQLGPYACPPGYCSGDTARDTRKLEKEEGTEEGGAAKSKSSVSAAAAVAAASNVTVALVNPCSAHRSLSEDNPLCGRCDPGYWEWNGECGACPRLDVPLVLALVVAACAGVAALHLVSRTAAPSARISILFFFIQTSLLLLHSKSATELERVFAFLHVFNLSWMPTTGSRCLAQLTAQQRIWLDAWMPILMLLPLAAMAAAQWVWIKRSRSAASSPPSPSAPAPSSAPPSAFPVAHYVRTSVVILQISFQQLCVNLLSFLQCVHVGPHLVVWSAPSIDCRSVRGLQAFAILLLLALTVAAPIAIIVLLRRHRHAVQAQIKLTHMRRARAATRTHPPAHPGRGLALASEPALGTGPVAAATSAAAEMEMNPIVDEQPQQVAAADADEHHFAVRVDGHAAASADGISAATSSSSSSSFVHGFDCVYLPFRDACYLWLPVLLLRRVALVCVAVLLLPHPSVQGLLFNTLCLLILLSHLQLRPFRDDTDNRLEGASLLALLLLSFLLTAQSDDDDGRLPLATQLFAALLLLLPLIILAAACAVHLLQRPAVRRMLPRCCHRYMSRRRLSGSLASGDAASASAAAGASDALSSSPISSYSSTSAYPGLNRPLLGDEHERVQL